MNWFDLLLSGCLIVFACVSAGGKHPDPSADLFSILLASLGIIIIYLRNILDAIREQHK